MKLTDADRVEIRSVLREELGFDQIMEVDKQLYLAGKRAGREDMRERAAEAVRGVLRMWLDRYPCADAIATVKLDHMIDAIRALGVDDD